MSKHSRRHMLQTGLVAASAVGLASTARADEKVAKPPIAVDAPASPKEKQVTSGKINQSVCRWCYGKISLDDLAVAAKAIGLKSIELLGAKEIETVKKHGLTCAVVNSHRIEKGLNRKENHEACLKAIREGIDVAAAHGCPNVITFSGNREGMDEETGLKNCTEALKSIVGYAEEKKVTVIMELLNSRVNHKDYMCDNSAWGVELCKRVGSDRFKLLYDIYHMQIMEGDVMRRIKDNAAFYGHYHTGGNPGRNEIDETQELYYPAIMKAIAATGYTGFVGQEFIPKRDALVSLAQAAKICDV